jgi:membrane fusion protein, macrolide-specific efflux system
MNTRRVGLVAILTVLLVVGFLIFWRYNSNENLKPKVGNVVESIYGLGTVTADQVYQLRAGIILEVRKLFVKEGDLVKPNDPVVKFDDNVMRSKIFGTITSVAFKEGELVPPQVPIVTITNLEHLHLEVSLEQQSVLRIKREQKVLISFETLRSEKYEGLVKSVYPRDSQFIVRIELENWPRGVLPGMTADVAIIVGEKKNILLIPIRSIVAGKVTRLRSNKKELVPVQLGVIDGEWGEVTSENISIDDELITRK